MRHAGRQVRPGDPTVRRGSPPLLRLLAGMLALAALAAAADYAVDSAGGPLTLHEDLDAAVLGWRNVAEDVTLDEDPAAATLFAYGDPDLMGPDTVTLTLQQEGAVTRRILVHPDEYGSWPGALAHEIGLLLGVPAGTTGVMNPALGPGSPREPTPEDAGGLQAARSQVFGDLNGDGIVDWYDLLEMAAQHGRRGVNLPADLDGDGTVTDADLRLLREVYEFLPPGDTPAAAPTPAPGEAADEGQDQAPDSPPPEPAPGRPDGPGDSERPPAER